MERVVITGTGAVTPIGNSVKDYWDSLVSGKCGIDKVTRFDTTGFKAVLGAELKSFDPENYLDKKEVRRMDRFSWYAMAAAKEALSSSGILDYAKIDKWRAGVVFGSGVGGLETHESEHDKLRQKGPGRVSPFYIPMMIANMSSAYISMYAGFRGTCYTTVTACASSSHAIGEAFRAIKHGYMDVVVAGGTEATITEMAFAGFSNMQALSTSKDPNAASLPFDLRRNGFVMGEGAGALVLESLTHARARGAEIIAEIGGYGTTADAYHITSPDPEGEGAMRAMLDAVDESGLDKEDINYINAHGTGTALNDKYETLAIKKAFSEHAYKLYVSSTKSMTGHLLGAAGAIEAIACSLAVKDGIVPPTINLKEQDPECDLNYTPGCAIKADINAAISNSLGFGGHNACILVKKY